MLGDIWYSAWQQAPIDEFLKRQLAGRRAEHKAPAQRGEEATDPAFWSWPRDCLPGCDSIEWLDY